jgi:hypothetical protein
LLRFLELRRRFEGRAAALIGAALAFGLPLFTGPEIALAQAGRAVSGPTTVIGRHDPAQLSGLEDGGVIVETKNRGREVVRFVEIWRIRRAFASDEPRGTTVIDFADNRLFVATTVPDLIALVSQKLPLIKLTAPSGETIYLAANKITDVFPSLPGVHNPDSRTVAGTRYGIQQVKEPIGTVQSIVAAARPQQ